VTHLVVALCSLALLAAPLYADSQPSGKIAKIGVLLLNPPTTTTAVLWDGLRDLGYVRGRDFVRELRWSDRRERLSELARELVALQANVIVAGGDGPALAAQAATATIPIVVLSGNQLVEAGLVASLARPGGNVTEMTDIDREQSGKYLELIKEILPALSRVGVIWNPDLAYSRSDLQVFQTAALALVVRLQPLEVRQPEDLEAAFKAFARERAQAVVVSPGNPTYAKRQLVADLGLRHCLPVVSGVREYADAGCLATYGPGLATMYRRIAMHSVDRILKGAKPADLPIERPMKLELVINLKTAKALGLTIPPAVLARADEVIE
jgi:putative ABC transport system substrate-binding protein